jgi:hypothetical protein
MGDLAAKEVAAKSKGELGRFADGEGLYFVVQIRKIFLDAPLHGRQ